MKCGAPAAWWSIPACTPWAGRASRQSTSWLPNTSVDLLNITNEVDRYIAWPGQALAYKIGEIEDPRAARKGGSKRSARVSTCALFHDTLIGSGAVPLDVLEEMVNTWVESRK